MLIGHYAIALAAKKVAPNVSLGLLATAAVFLDLIWPPLLLAGIEHVEVVPGATVFTPLDFVHYPWSHSLLMAGAWGAVFAILRLVLKSDLRGALVLMALVISHWLLDLPMHRPDLPLTPWGPERYGYGLWNDVAVTMSLEIGLLLAGVWIYVRATRTRDTIGRWALSAFVLLLLVFYAAAAFGPPPPDERTVGISANIQWLIILFAWWVDSHRTVRGRLDPIVRKYRERVRADQGDDAVASSLGDNR